MTFKTVEPRLGLRWYVDAWNIFKAQIGMWLLLVLIYFGLMIVLESIPLIGQLAFVLISPALVGGMYLAAQEVEAGRPLDVKILFQPLLSIQKRGPILTLGAINIAFALVSMLIMVAFIGSSVGTSLMLNYNVNAILEQMMGTAIIGLLIILVLLVIFTMVMVYAVPLVLFADISPMQSLKLSFAACTGNWLALLIFGLILIPLAILASLLFMVGWLFLFPIIMIAVYVSYKDIFGIVQDVHAQQPSEAVIS